MQSNLNKIINDRKQAAEQWLAVGQDVRSGGNERGYTPPKLSKRNRQTGRVNHFKQQILNKGESIVVVGTKFKKSATRTVPSGVDELGNPSFHPVTGTFVRVN